MFRVARNACTVQVQLITDSVFFRRALSRGSWQLPTLPTPCQVMVRGFYFITFCVRLYRNTPPPSTTLAQVVPRTLERRGVGPTPLQATSGCSEGTSIPFEDLTGRPVWTHRARLHHLPRAATRLPRRSRKRGLRDSVTPPRQQERDGGWKGARAREGGGWGPSNAHPHKRHTRTDAANIR